MAEHLLEEQRENWGSRAGFVLAAIGSAVGLGNLWGFPYKVYSYGGGAFLLPYILAMALIGVPLMVLEFALGHMTQRAAPDAFRGVSRRTEPLGWWGILLSFIIITYYAVILAWCLNFLVVCVRGIVSGGELPWAGKGIEGVANAKRYFYATYLNTWSEAEIAGGAVPWGLGRVAEPIVISLVATWLLLYLCIFRGVKAVSKVVLITVPLPWIMLLILTVRGLTLPGAAEGLKFYLEPNWSELAKPDTWRWAFGQMFFSMSLAFGVMITYASFMHRKSDINNNALIIGLSDMGTSFIAGIAVFATLGGMSFATRQAGQPIPVAEVAAAGPGMSFVAFPYALAQLPYSAWFGAVFFLALITLGIDSAFSITESVLASLVDKTRWNRNVVLIALSVVGLGIGLVYCTRGGLEWLGAMDDFINSTWGGIALLGLLECVVLGWGYRIARLREHANELSDWKLGLWWDGIIRYVAPVLLSTLFVWSLLDKAASEGGFLYDKNGTFQTPMLVGLILAGLVPLLAVVLSLIRSPGANTHAAHVGQPRYGRAEGVVGVVLLALAYAGLAVAFALARQAKADGGGHVPYAQGWLAVIVAGLAAAPAIAAAGIGAAVVHRAEATQHRPSAFGRLSAGLGTMGVGACLGVLLPALFFLHDIIAPSPASAPAPAEQAELSWVSYVVLAAMLVLLVGGLGWCFYRAVRAAGGAAPAQPAETMDQ